MSDYTPSPLIGDVPSNCIVLLKNLDAAFTRRRSRRYFHGAPATKDATATASESKDAPSDGSTLSLSGHLNILDGVAAAEGRLLFVTTNRLNASVGPAAWMSG